MAPCRTGRPADDREESRDEHRPQKKNTAHGCFSMTQSGQSSPEVRKSVAADILSGIEALVNEARQDTKPLEIDPYRSRLFELFVTADGARLIPDDRETG